MFSSFLFRQFSRVSKGGWEEFFGLIIRSVSFIFGLLPAVFFVILMRIIRPLYLIRINKLISPRLGHLAANTELYLCERIAGINVPEQMAYVDLHFLGGCRVSNKQLARMWKRKLNIWPKWFIEPTYLLNKLIPGGSVHDVGSNYLFGRDALNLHERIPAQLKFTHDEEVRGKQGLIDIGIPSGAEFICLMVRDDAYLNKFLPAPGNWAYHSYRDSDVNNYLLAAEDLTERGYYVVLMGEIVNAPVSSKNSKIIDYATNGMRSDFMDIYLGANCLFCLTSGTGFDGVPSIFRKRICYVNIVPIGFVESYRKDAVFLSKRYWLKSEQRELTLKQIFNYDIGHSLSNDECESMGVTLIENTPEEIRDAAIEMLESLKGEWLPDSTDEKLQQKFWDIFPSDKKIDHYFQKAVHGKIRSRYSSKYLRAHPKWLQ